MNEKWKKTLDFVLLKPAVSSRNLTSIALVAAFFGVYIAAGGKIAALPNVQRAGGFGTVDVSGKDLKTPDKKVQPAKRNTVSKEIEAAPAPKPVKKERQISLFDFEDSAAAPKKKVQEVEQPAEEIREEVGDADSLSNFQDRLNKLRSNRK